MKHMIHILTLTFFIGVGQTAIAEGYNSGMRNIEIKDDNTRALEGIVWYPVASDIPLQRHHKNGVWRGVDVAENAKPLGGTFPLVVLSHGMYGNARNQNWLAVELVKRGYVAISLNHPGTSTWLRNVDDARQMWERPKDVSRAISYMLDTPALGFKVDLERIYMAGHSLGGMTAVQLAGGRYAPEQMDAICQQNPSELLCGLIAMWHIGETPEDRKALTQDLTDPRIKAFAVLDLGGTQTFSKDSLAEVTTPMLVIGAPKDSGGALDLDIESRALVAQLPEPTTHYIQPASLTHFDFLGICTENAIPILEAEVPGDGMVCVDGTNERIADHTLISDSVLAFFAKH